MIIEEKAKQLQQELVKWRRDLHGIPEIGFRLDRTSEYVVARLKELGIEHKIVAETGIIGTIYGSKSGKTVALRADMDALPILEETDLSFASDNGCMHACGHDAHMAMLLGAAKLLMQNRETLHGAVRLIFQPAEENIGGAERMIEEGCLEHPKVDMIFGLHIGSLSPEIGCGQIGIRAGAMMAAVDDFQIQICGKGGHGAAPHECVDPVVITSEIICALQKIVSREIAPVNPAVLTIGKIHGGTAFNIIPDSVTFEGCVRTLTATDREHMEQRICAVTTLIAQANRASSHIKYQNKYPILINDEEATTRLEGSANKVVGFGNVVRIEKPIMASEDMAYYLEKIQGSFFYLGSNNEAKGIVQPHHHPKFDLDEEVLWKGSAVMAQAAMDFLME